MATLNIKNFPEALYEQLQEREHRSPAQQVIHLLEESTARAMFIDVDLPPPASGF